MTADFATDLATGAISKLADKALAATGGVLRRWARGVKPEA